MATGQITLSTLSYKNIMSTGKVDVLFCLFLFTWRITGCLLLHAVKFRPRSSTFSTVSWGIPLRILCYRNYDGNCGEDMWSVNQTDKNKEYFTKQWINSCLFHLLNIFMTYFLHLLLLFHLKLYLDLDRIVCFGPSVDLDWNSWTLGSHGGNNFFVYVLNK